MRKIALSNLSDLFAAMAADRTLYLPLENKKGKCEFGKWTEGATMSSALNTERSAKDFFFPQSENLMRLKMEGKQLEILDERKESEDFVVFGVRACDAKSFEVLDRVFLSEPVDSYYASRRAHSIIFTMACTKPAETCFCGCFGIDPAAPAGDVSCWIDKENLYLSANTEKGEAYLATLSLTQEAADSDIAEICTTIHERMAKLPLADLTTEGFGGGKTAELFNHPAWAELSESCLGCGTCTFVCPTCQCYDIKDFNTGHGVIRYRCWDSCMYSEFTRMAHGNNRLSQKERFRQRFMHKLVYYPENNDGLFSCVGCGRCLAKCPISMNIVKVMKKIGGNKGE